MSTAEIVTALPIGAREHLDRAHDLRNREERGAALRECQAAIELAPEWAEAHNLRGRLLDELGHLPQAIEAYQQAPDYDPGLEEARDTLLEAEQAVAAVPLAGSSAALVGKGFGIRAGSYLVDSVILAATTYAFMFLALVLVLVLLYVFDPGAATYLVDEPTPNWPFTLIGGVLFLLYFALFEWLYGATPGKLLLGMRVIGQDGGRCSARAALTRGVLRYVDAFFFCVPALVAMKPPLQQRIGDKAARTVVVGSKDPAIRQRREWGWFLVAVGLYCVLYVTVDSLALLGIVAAAGPS